PTYHLINEASAPVQPLSSTPQQKETLLTTMSQQTQLQQQAHPHTLPNQHSQSQQSHRYSMRPRQKYPHFQSPRPENFFVGTEPTQELVQQPPLQQQQQQEQLQPDGSYAYFNDETLTPQEKYVRYLQQRIRYNKQQQKQRDRIKGRENFIKQQQSNQQHQQSEEQHLQQPPTQIFVLTPPPPPSPFAHHSNQKQLDANAQVNYPQHSPIRHAVYPHPELHVPSNHQPPTNVATLKQVVKIPVRTLVSEALDAFQQHQQEQQHLVAKGGANGGVYRQQPQYANSLGPPTTQYIDYIVDDPKQSLEDEQQHSPAAAVAPQKPTAQQNAFIVISTSSPPQITPGGIGQEFYDSTSRPVYKQQPTLRLQPLPQAGKSNSYATRRPIVAAEPPPPQPPLHIPQSSVTPAAVKPKYIYAESNFGDVIKSTTPAIKLRPSQKYSGGIGSRLTPPAPPPRQLAPSPPHQGKQQVNLPEYYNPPVPVAAQTTPVADPNQLPDIRSSSLADILHKLQASNHLPRTLTPENIDNSIKTLVMILENLKQTQTIVPNPAQHHERPAASQDYDYSTDSEEVNGGAPDLSSVLSPVLPNKHPGPSTGRAGIDYPNLADIPQTNFNCAEQRYKGFFGDPETNCQVWHYCDLNGGKASFLCPNGTIFSQIALTCDWWFNVKCSTTAQLYVLNERLYKYILPFTPKFPEDYSGPLVDKYLAMKFQEMEEKMRIEKEKVEKSAIAAAIAATSATQTNNHIESEEVNGVRDAENVNNAADDDVEDTEVTTVADLSNLPRTLSAPNRHGVINAHVSEQSSERNLLIDDEVDDISQRGSIDTFESSTIPTASAPTVAKDDGMLALSQQPIVVSSTQGPDYDDVSADERRIPAHNVRNVEEATSRTLTTETVQRPPEETTTTQSQTKLRQNENQEQIQASPKPVRQTTNIDVEKVEVIEIKAEGAAGQMGPKMYYGAESAKDVR
ncbi:PREDICTED: uncharacterized protein LOC108377149, partial [Rhagoletis zephyria]|uniref:uncharacterized protein LOC108377149 n=1 Tax=Rhagoletis zephyria TaxID=28612 RepID=UPI000811523F